MSLKSWLASLRALVIGTGRARSRLSQRKPPARRLRPNLEALEDRLVPTTLTALGQADLSSPLATPTPVGRASLPAVNQSDLVNTLSNAVPAVTIAPSVPVGGTSLAVVTRNNIDDVFGINSSGHLFYVEWNAQTNTHTQPIDLEQGVANAPTFPVGGNVAADSRNPGEMDVFAIDSKGHLWTDWWAEGDASTGWTGHLFMLPSNLPGNTLKPGGSLAVNTRNPNEIDVFSINTNGQIWTTWWNGTWTNHQYILPQTKNLVPGGSLAVNSRNSNEMDVFSINTAGQMWTTWWNGDGAYDGWVGTATLSGSGQFPAGGSLAVSSLDSNHMELFAINNKGAMWSDWWNGTWSSGTDSPNFSYQPGASVTVARLDSGLGGVQVFAINQFDAVVSQDVWGSTLAGSLSTGGMFLPDAGLASDARNGGLAMDVFAIDNNGQLWSNRGTVSTNGSTLAPVGTFHAPQGIMLSGPIASEYHFLQSATDASGKSVQMVLGPCLSISTLDGQWVAHFMGGDIYSTATHAGVVYETVEATYNSLGGPNGILGRPISDETNVFDVPGARVANFSGGDIYLVGSNAFVVSGAIWGKYDSLGGPEGSLGLPTGDVISLGDGAFEQHFQNGTLILLPNGAVVTA